jgi:peptide/nickel transport system ATP-binding protein
MTAPKGSPGPIVAVDGVTVRFAQRPPVVALADVSLNVRPDTVLGVIGESGSGKTTLARCMLGIVRPTAGSVRFAGQDLYAMPEHDRFRLIGRQAALVFQDPRSSLNQRLRVGSIVGEPLVVHESMSRPERRERIRTLLESVGLDPSLSTRPARRLSGGQLQRVALARALALDPPLIVADEPTSALDVSVQAQILGLIDRLRAARSFAMVVVSHDMRIIRHLADEVAVMYAGRVVEYGTTDEVCRHSRHPYTLALLAAVPQLHQPPRVLDHLVSSATPSSGCPFANRCPRATSECAVDPVPVRMSATGHYARCYHPDEGTAAVGSPAQESSPASQGE